MQHIHRCLLGGRVVGIASAAGLSMLLSFGSLAMAAGGQKAGSAWNMAVVGQSDLDGRGFNGDVWVHDGVAYVGQWGFIDWATGNDRFCPTGPDSGVAVIDVHDPANPTRIATLQNPTGTSAEDVVAYTASYGPMAGRDIAAVGSGLRRIALRPER